MVRRRECKGQIDGLNGWKWPAFMLAYLFALAYLASFVTYRVASALLG